jgi:hypothetical protein
VLASRSIVLSASVTLSPCITDDANQIDDGPEEAREGFRNDYANLEASFFKPALTRCQNPFAGGSGEGLLLKNVPNTQPGISLLVRWRTYTPTLGFPDWKGYDNNGYS